MSAGVEHPAWCDRTRCGLPMSPPGPRSLPWGEGVCRACRAELAPHCSICGRVMGGSRKLADPEVRAHHACRRERARHALRATRPTACAENTP